jgi:hypothetical protein
MPDPLEFNSFARRVLRGTKTGVVAWAPSEQDGTVFVAETDRGSIRISSHEVSGRVDAIRLEVLNADGRVVDTTETDPTREGPWLDWEDTLNELYPAAQFAGSGTAQTLRELSDAWGLPPDPQDEELTFSKAGQPRGV